jgi:starvation-inducible outer membrane lipoprotein
MNSSITQALSLRSTVATLLVGAALLLSACSTTSTARVESPADKSVSFLKLHNEMVRLASEPSSWGEIRPAGTVVTASADLHGGSDLAVNR